MKKLFLPFNTLFIVVGLILSTVSYAAAPEAPAVSQKQNRSNFKQFTGWLRKSYGAPRKDGGILWEYVNKKVRFQKIDDELSAQAWSIMKRYGIPLGVMLVLAGGAWGFRRVQAKRIEAKDESGMTALMWASREGNKEKVEELLLKAGVEIDAKDESGKTALLRAVFGGNLDMVKLLLEEGANKEATDKDGYTALMEAAFWGKKDIVQMLLEEGANKEAADNYGYTAAALAGSGEIRDMINKYRASQIKE